jgi:hypothetical protein
MGTMSRRIMRIEEERQGTFANIFSDILIVFVILGFKPKTPIFAGFVGLSLFNIGFPSFFSVFLD